jgi:lipopolysaccharide export system protein LptA
MAIPGFPAALGMLSVAALLFSAAHAASPPLVMEHADRLEGVRSTGEHVLSGNVRFRHGDLVLETQRALWERSRNRVTAERGLRVTHRGAVLTADRGSYDRGADRARAEGNVRMRDSSGEVRAEGARLDYDRLRRDAVLSGNPVARRFYPARPADPVAGTSAREADTLVIRGKRLRYNDSTRAAEADGDAVITRRDLRITAGRAVHRGREDSLILSGDPVVRVEDSEIRGVHIRIGLSGEELRGLLVRGAAEAVSREKATDSTRERHSRVTGDSLRLAAIDGGIDSVQVFARAEGTYWEPERPEYVNRVNGDYMVLRFRNRGPREAEILGSARSTYYHFEGDSLKGKNRAGGEVMIVGFSGGRVEDILVKGAGAGVYEGRALGTAPPGSARPAAAGEDEP